MHIHRFSACTLSSVLFLALSLQVRYQRRLSRDCRGNYTQPSFTLASTLVPSLVWCPYQDYGLCVTFPQSILNLSLFRTSFQSASKRFWVCFPRFLHWPLLLLLHLPAHLALSALDKKPGFVCFGQVTLVLQVRDVF